MIHAAESEINYLAGNEGTAARDQVMESLTQSLGSK
jgi:hypothetical protein